jgi:hypothetical protein
MRLEVLGGGLVSPVARHFYVAADSETDRNRKISATASNQGSVSSGIGRLGTGYRNMASKKHGHCDCMFPRIGLRD